MLCRMVISLLGMPLSLLGIVISLLRLCNILCRMLLILLRLCLILCRMLISLLRLCNILCRHCLILLRQCLILCRHCLILLRIALFCLGSAYFTNTASATALNAHLQSITKNITCPPTNILKSAEYFLDLHTPKNIQHGTNTSRHPP